MLKILIPIIFTLPNFGFGAILICEGQEPDTEFRREIRLSFEGVDSYLIQLEPINDEAGESKFINDSIPIGIGSIEIYDVIEDQRELWANGDLLVTQANSSLVAGILLRFSRIYTIRIDKSDNVWSFILHDQTRSETLTGECR